MTVRRIAAGVAVVVFIVLALGAVWAAKTLWVVGSTVPEHALSPSLATSLYTGEPVATAAVWEAEKPFIRYMFEEEVYGAFPKANIRWLKEVRVLDEHAYGDTAVVEEIIFTPALQHSSSTGLRVPVVVVTPKGATSSPLIIGSTFCANHTAFPQYQVEKPAVYPAFCEVSSPTSFRSRFMRFILGKYIEEPPVADIVARGFAYANFYTGSIAPDDKDQAPEALIELSKLTGEPVTGVIAAWAWGYTQVMHELEVDPRIDPTKVALYGHSRDGKAALVAGAFDESVDAVIAHQSGRGGASPAQLKTGESIDSVMHEYPHWFDPSYLGYEAREEALPVDQHLLIALMAPRPVLLTGAYLDKWADPKGAFMAMRDAEYIYRLYNKYGDERLFPSETLDQFHPGFPLAFFMRPLNHGIRDSDWDAFIRFLESHFCQGYKCSVYTEYRYIFGD